MELQGLQALAVPQGLQELAQQALQELTEPMDQPDRQVLMV